MSYHLIKKAIGKANRLSESAVDSYTKIHRYFNESKSLTSKILSVISWPLRIIFNLPAQALILINYYYAKYLFSVRNEIKIIGVENVPAGVGTLFLSNHQTWLDPWGMCLALIKHPRQVIVSPSEIFWTVADDTYYGKQWFGPLLRLAKMITVERHSLSAGLKIAQHQARCRRLLTIGNLVIYFEGGRSSDGTIKQCKNSIAELIFDNLHSNGQSGFIKNIVPMRIFGFTEIQPPESDKHSLKKAKLNPWQVAKNKKCQVVVGKSINDLIKPDHTVEDIKQIIYESVSSITI